MRTWTHGAAVTVGVTLFAGCALLNGPLQAHRPVDGATFAPVVARYAGSVGKVLSTTCYGTPIAGSGFVVDPHHLLTAAHVVDGARQVSLRLTGSDPILADVVGIDPARDTALLRTTAELAAPPFALAEGGSTVPGTTVVALGYPLSDSALHTEATRITAITDTAIVNDRSMDNLVTLDSTLRPGSSGGPAVDAEGTVRGMVVAAFGGRGGRDSASTVALAIPTASLAESVALWRDARPVTPKECDGESATTTPPDLDLAGDAGDPELAQTLWLLGSSINRGQWGSAWGMLTDDLRRHEGNQDAWTVATAGTRWTRLELQRATRQGERATARARVRTSGADGCRLRTVDYAFRLDQGIWLVDGVTAGEAAACG